MRQRILPVLVAGFVGVLVATSAAAGSARPGIAIDEDPPDCTQIPPDEMPQFSLEMDASLDLDVRILAEKPDLATAKRLMRTTTWAFDRIGIDLDVTYDAVAVPAEWASPAGTLPDRTSEELWSLIKDHYDGTRPKGVDIVYYFTRYWGGGMADCIGGVRFADKAFAFGSIDYALESVVPMPTVDEGVIAAHEIGHLLGAHHHYFNCVEAAPNGAMHTMAAACTTMSPSATLASPIFGVLEANFVRYYTDKYAN